MCCRLPPARSRSGGGHDESGQGEEEDAFTMAVTMLSHGDRQWGFCNIALNLLKNQSCLRRFKAIFGRYLIVRYLGNPAIQNIDHIRQRSAEGCQVIICTTGCDLSREALDIRIARAGEEEDTEEDDNSVIVAASGDSGRQNGGDNESSTTPTRRQEAR